MTFFTSPYYIGLVLSTAALYMTAGTGAAICIKSGEFNLGGEGQIYTGGFLCALLLEKLSAWPSFPAILLSFILSGAFSAVIALISAVLKKLKNAEFLLTSFILSTAIIPLIDGLIAGPFRGSSNNLLATAFLPQKFRFESLLPPSSFNAFFLVALIICIGGGLFIYKTAAGKRICIFGQAREFALYSGYSEKTSLFLPAGISGALHGITGAAAVCGTYFTCHSGFYAGMGWNALSCALIAKSNPFLIIPSALFISYAMNFSNYISLYSTYNFDISGLIQAIIIFMVAIPFYRRKEK